MLVRVGVLVIHPLPLRVWGPQEAQCMGDDTECRAGEGGEESVPHEGVPKVMLKMIEANAKGAKSSARVCTLARAGLTDLHGTSF